MASIPADRHPSPPLVTEVRRGVFRVDDVVNVWVIRSGEPGSPAVVIDFGSGQVLDLLADLGVSRVEAVLMTHHHRDQGQGLPRAVAAGIPIWVPPQEQDLFSRVEEFWAGRRVHNDYSLLTDRFSLLTCVPIAGTVAEYRSQSFGDLTVETLPTPGHTPGSVTYLIERDGERIAFTGDLIHSPGRVWSLAATQWTYTGNEGPSMTALSALVLAAREPDLLLPSHGDPMPEAIEALEQLVDNLHAYLNSRRPEGWLDLRTRLAHPFEEISPHLLRNTTSESASYVLLSDSGAALFIDFGYDQTSWYPLGGPRHSQRPLLASLPALKERGVTAVDVVLTTHYHDDHVAGVSLLRAVEGTQVWAPTHVAAVLQNPLDSDLPCQWFDPIPVDRELELGAWVQWREYRIRVHDLPGHTRAAAAFEFEVDGVRVLATGDQQDTLGEPGRRRDLLNYQYRNQLDLDDYRRSADLYRQLRPGLFITGHWGARAVDDHLIERLAGAGQELVELHHRLLPLQDWQVPLDGQLARLRPYQQRARAGQELTFTVELVNPFDDQVTARVSLVGLPADVDHVECLLPPAGSGRVELSARVPDTSQSRWVVAADVCFGRWSAGQVAEALIDLDHGDTSTKLTR